MESKEAKSYKAALVLLCQIAIGLGIKHNVLDAVWLVLKSVNNDKEDTLKTWADMYWCMKGAADIGARNVDMGFCDINNIEGLNKAIEELQTDKKDNGEATEENEILNLICEAGLLPPSE